MTLDLVDLQRDVERVSNAVEDIKSNPNNWIVADIKVEGSEIVKIVFKPLDVSSYCSALFGKCGKTLSNLSRFQIITKVPYPSKGDRWTDTKRERDSQWYYWQTALRLIQAYGRSIRSKEDWAHTYILDSAFSSFLKHNKMPEWFTEAITTGVNK